MKIQKTIIYGIPMHECHVELYDQYFYLFFGVNNLKKFYREIDEDGEDADFNARGMVLSHENKRFPECIYMWFPNKDFERIKKGTLAHECMHLIDYISMNKGLKHDVKNQEVYAQFMGYLFRNLLPLFKKK